MKKAVANKNLAILCHHTMTIEDFEQGMKTLFGSSHMRTKFLANPGMATHGQLLWLAEKTGRPAYTLVEEYGVALQTLTGLEIEQLQFVERMKEFGQAA